MKKILSDLRFKLPTVVLAALMGFALSPNICEAKPVAAMGTPDSAHIILGDDKVEFCPPEGFLAIGKDVNGVDYFGCWRFKPTDPEVVQIIWAQEPDTILELPKALFEGIVAKPEMKV